MCVYMCGVCVVCVCTCVWYVCGMCVYMCVVRVWYVCVHVCGGMCEMCVEVGGGLGLNGLLK